MTSLNFRAIEDADVDDVIALWTKAGLTRPHNDPRQDIAFARMGPASEILVGKDATGVVASVMVGHDGHRGTVYYVSVDPDRRGHGFGRQAMEAAEAWLRARGIWKLNLLIRQENQQVQSFYAALGYEVEPRIAMSRWLEDGRRGDGAKAE